MKLVFFGTPAFAVPVLQAVHSAGHEILAVVTQPDRPRGRKKVLTPPEAKVCAQALGLSVLQFERIKRPEAVQAWTDFVQGVAGSAAQRGHQCTCVFAARLSRRRTGELVLDPWGDKDRRYDDVHRCGSG